MKLFSLLLILAGTVIDNFFLFFGGGAQQVGATQLSNYPEVVKGLNFGMAIPIVTGIMSYRWVRWYTEKKSVSLWDGVNFLFSLDLIVLICRTKIIMPTL